MSTGQKHLVRCRCVLPQFKHLRNPPAHQFLVFSVINDDNTVKIKYSQCTNCGIVHKVNEINRSEIVSGKEAMSSILTVSDIKSSLPEQLCVILENNAVDDVSTWEAVQHIYENKQWGNFVVMTSDTDGSLKQGKYVRILGEKLFKVETYTRDEVIR